MMGRTHATSGAVAFLALVPPLRAAGIDVDGVGVAVGAIAAAGAAMLPDLDHPHASVARAAGPITGVLARLVSAVSGGHRNGTHSLLGVVAAVAVSTAVLWAGRIPVGVMLAFLAALALAAIRVQLSRVTIVHTTLCVIIGITLAGLSIFNQVPIGLLPWAVGIGTIAHIAGDCLTTEGCPLLWPWGWRLSVLGLTTEGVIERLVVGPALGLAAVLLAWQLTDPAILTAQLRAIGQQITQSLR